MDESSRTRLGFLGRIYWEKLVIWALFLLFLYVIRDFFTLLFLTFILSYIFFHLSEWFLSKGFRKRRPRWARVTVVTFLYLVFLAGVVAGVVFLGPRVYSQARDLVSRVEKYEAGKKIADQIDHTLRETIGDKTGKATRPFVEDLLLLGPEEEDKARERLNVFLGNQGLPQDSPRKAMVVEEMLRRLREYHRKSGLRNAVASFLAENLGVKRSSRMEKMVEEGERYLVGHIPSLVEVLQGFVKSIFNGLVSLLLSIIFSFLILLDLPRIGRAVESLSRGRAARFYEEIKPTMVSFASVIGKAFQAQAVIALLNTAFTFAGIRILGIPHAAVLSVIVFLCSFIPVVGVFISSTPMVILALQMEGGGIGMAFNVVILVTIVHILEAYLFNPRIMGEFLHMHPLFVLLVLVVAEHFFHIWGLLLGVPVAYYVFTQVLLGGGEPSGRST